MKIDLKQIHNKNLAILAIDENDEHVVFLGLAKWEKNKLYFVVKGKVHLHIPDDIHYRIRKVKSDFKDIFRNADYFISMNVKNQPESGSDCEFLKTGLKWPE